MVTILVESFPCKPGINHVPDPAPDNACELALPCHNRQILESTPVACVPAGCLEYHGPIRLSAWTFRVEAAMLDLPGGTNLEILNSPGGRSSGKFACNPGNVRFCIEVDDAERMRQGAVAAGTDAPGTGPIDITEGPNAGAKSCYLRDPDGITLELYQPKPFLLAIASPD